MNRMKIVVFLIIIFNNALLAQETEVLNEIILKNNGIVDLANKGKTPIAISMLENKDLQAMASNQEFVSLLNQSPSVYATKGGGGFGDSRLSLRGFDQSNTAFLLNGIPLNDIQGGWVYWSNTLGIYDVAKQVQVQRGLGISQLAIPSVGGTINIITKQAGEKRGGIYAVEYGNDGYLKNAFSYDSNVNKNGWSTSIYLNKWNGDGYVDGTEGAGVAYFFGLSYAPSKKIKLNTILIGAGQWHNRRANPISLVKYLINKNTDFRKYNSDWGYLNGETYSFNKNFYQKPMTSVSLDYKINSAFKWSTTLFGAWGRGGETFKGGDVSWFRTQQGIVDIDAVVTANTQGVAYTGPNSVFTGNIIGNDGVNNNVVTRNAYMNSHNAYGLLSKISFKNKKITTAFGVDIRTHKGSNFAVLNDLLGLDGLQVNTPLSNSGTAIYTQTVVAKPFKSIHSESPQKIFFHNVAKTKIAGVNTMIKYHPQKKYRLLLQMGLSQQKYQRTEYFYTAKNQDSEIAKLVGGFAKGGVNYKFDNFNSLFVNAGKIYRQPYFYDVFPNSQNKVNKDLNNEKITSFDLGYNFKQEKFNFSINAYHTTWGNRYLTKEITLPSGIGKASFSKLKEIHKGIEIEASYQILKKIQLKGMLSIGDWEYDNSVTAKVFDNTQTNIGSSTLYLKGVKVGNAAQTTSFLSALYKPGHNFNLNISWQHASKLYATLSVLDDAFLQENNKGALALPNYNLFNISGNYKLRFNKQSLVFNLSVNNVLDATYISEANTNIHLSPTTIDTYKGVDTVNSVWFGAGQTWSANLKFIF